MRLRAFLLIIIIVVAYCIFNWEDLNEPSYLHEKSVPAENVYSYKNVVGPMDKSVISKPPATSWRKYQTENPSALSILLTDTLSGWLGIVHGLKNIGIPVSITTDVNTAIQHETVLVYPIISGKVLTKQELQKLAAIPRNGGNLIGVNVYGGGLNEVFGFESIVANSSYNQLLIPDPNVTKFTEEFNKYEEQNIILTNPVDFPDEMPTNAYTKARTPLIVYKQDSAAFLTYKDYGVGHAFAFGLDLGNYFLRYMNERGFNAYRGYANQYAPGMDVILRILKNIYTNTNNVVTIGTVPFNKDFSLILTHDIDFTKSIVNTVDYANMENSLGVKATYFIQTKYIKDWNDDIFLTEENIKYLNIIKSLGMEIASHSISHSRMFSEFPLGTGEEYYPRYRPFVQEQLTTYNASIFGELRVSKFLLEKLVNNVNVISFRPGHLEYPFALPQALESSGYKYSSSVTANNVQTHLPYMLMYNREFESEMDLVEIPVTIEDELGVPLIQRLDSSIALAKSISSYGGVINVLIHTDKTGDKLKYERTLIEKLKSDAWVGTIKDLGNWWYLRNQVDMSVSKNKDFYEVKITNPERAPIYGLTINIPESWDRKGAIIRNGKKSIVIDSVIADTILIFHKQNDIR